ncbi:MAG: YegP family protein [Casimicrobium sp.]
MATKERKWEFYQDKAAKHRWRVQASNGNTIAASSQGYVTLKDCVHNASILGYTGDPKPPVLNPQPQKPPKRKRRNKLL